MKKFLQSIKCFLGFHERVKMSREQCEKESIFGGVFTPWDCNHCGFASQRFLIPRPIPRPLPPPKQKSATTSKASVCQKKGDMHTGIIESIANTLSDGAISAPMAAFLRPIASKKINGRDIKQTLVLAVAMGDLVNVPDHRLGNDQDDSELWIGDMIFVPLSKYKGLISGGSPSPENVLTSCMNSKEFKQKIFPKKDEETQH